MNKFNKFVEISRALYSPNHPLRTFHTTFALKGSKLLAIGINNTKTHPKTLQYNYHEGDVGIHSELSAIIRLGHEDCSDFTFVNVRLQKDLSVANSMPCKGCLELMHQLNYKEFYYTTDQGNFNKL